MIVRRPLNAASRPAIRPATSSSATPPTHPADRLHGQPHAQETPGVQDGLPSLDCRAWKGGSNPLLLNPLRFAPESRTPIKLALDTVAVDRTMDEGVSDDPIVLEK